MDAGVQALRYGRTLWDSLLIQTAVQVVVQHRQILTMIRIRLKLLKVRAELRMMACLDPDI